MELTPPPRKSSNRGWSRHCFLREKLNRMKKFLNKKSVFTSIFLFLFCVVLTTHMIPAQAERLDAFFQPRRKTTVFISIGAGVLLPKLETPNAVMRGLQRQAFGDEAPAFRRDPHITNFNLFRDYRNGFQAHPFDENTLIGRIGIGAERSRFLGEITYENSQDIVAKTTSRQGNGRSKINLRGAEIYGRIYLGKNARNQGAFFRPFVGGSLGFYAVRWEIDSPGVNWVVHVDTEAGTTGLFPEPLVEKTTDSPGKVITTLRRLDMRGKGVGFKLGGGGDFLLTKSVSLSIEAGWFFFKPSVWPESQLNESTNIGAGDGRIHLPHDDAGLATFVDFTDPGSTSPEVDLSGPQAKITLRYRFGRK